MARFEIPTKLKNGADILAFKKVIGHHMIVFARWEDEFSVMPYITWAVDEEGNAYLGHYFKTYDEALIDWKERNA